MRDDRAEYHINEAMLPAIEARATYARWLEAVHSAPNIMERLRIQGMSNVETIAEFGPHAKLIKALQGFFDSMARISQEV